MIPIQNTFVHFSNKQTDSHQRSSSCPPTIFRGLPEDNDDVSELIYLEGGERSTSDRTSTSVHSSTNGYMHYCAECDDNEYVKDFKPCWGCGYWVCSGCLIYCEGCIGDDVFWCNHCFEHKHENQCIEANEVGDMYCEICKQTYSRLHKTGKPCKKCRLFAMECCRERGYCYKCSDGFSSWASYSSRVHQKIK